MMWITRKTKQNSQNSVRKISFGGTFTFSNCHIIGLDTVGLVFLVSGFCLKSISCLLLLELIKVRIAMALGSTTQAMLQMAKLFCFDCVRDIVFAKKEL
jgi:hypothetical protein